MPRYVANYVCDCANNVIVAFKIVYPLPVCLQMLMSVRMGAMAAVPTVALTLSAHSPATVPLSTTSPLTAQRASTLDLRQ